MINNFKEIRKLLKFENKDHFYFLQILQRKKDHKDGQKINGTNNNSRLIKAYYINSLEYFDFIEDEVIKLCDLFNARAGINLNRRSYEKMALHHLKKCTDQIINGDYCKAYKAYSSVVGSYSQENDKTWILDIDEKEISPLMLSYINYNCEPISKSLEESKIYIILPSKNGHHVITKPFNVKTFKDKYPEIEIHKNNPTNLYIP